jgi:plasmid stabilization system protein ParE
MFRRRGDDVRTAIRVNEELGDWAQGIIRFAPYPGPPSKEEADWFRDWLAASRHRWLVYVAYDFDSVAEYWKEVRDGLPDSPLAAERRAEAEEKRAEAENWVAVLPPRARTAADPALWFGVDSAWNPPRVCSRLSGPWAEGIDAAAAGLTLHEPLQSKHGSVLLEGDGKSFVLERSRPGEGRVLVIANGSFLLNEALAHRARRALAERVVGWTGTGGQSVALVEGSYLLGGRERTPTIWDLLKRLPELRWAAIHLGLAGLIAALARAPRLGRPRPEAPSGVDRPAAHAEALGALLARSGAAAEASEILERYRRWRHPRTRHEHERARSPEPEPLPRRALGPRPAPRRAAPMGAGGDTNEPGITFID